jgi:DMSO/TMAO reductase YedYZ molybdopterin-dependent catalytic subunit
MQEDSEPSSERAGAVISPSRSLCDDPQMIGRLTGGVSAGRAALAGAIGAAVAIGVSELIAGVLVGAPSLVASIGQVVINLQPAGAKDFVVALFGTNDKPALEIFITLVALAIAAGLGVVARRRFAILAVGFGVAGVIAAAAALADPQVSPMLAVLSPAVAVIAGIQAVSWLTAARTAPEAGERAASMPDWSRRGFVLRAGGLTIGAVATGLVGRMLLDRQRQSTTQAASTLQPPSETAALPPGAAFPVEGITPLVVPNDSFYRIDTALLPPSVDINGWTLRVRGMVDREVVLTFAELANLPMFEQYVTIACVSNTVGGDLVGNAKWTGVSLREVLDMAGVQAGATQLVGRSVDGWTAGMPMDWVMDTARRPMIAVEMNDQPLPIVHGFPARLIVPGLFGYVSATKWLAELELTTWEAFDAFWIPRGWSKKGPVLTQSRIDVPRANTQVTAGHVTVAGVAWAPDRGVTRVEVGIDGSFRDAKLSTPISKATWVQWQFDWDATPGRHSIAVRATDGTGETQTSERTAEAPDGARGWHTIEVSVG